jgi:Fic family protein
MKNIEKPPSGTSEEKLKFARITQELLKDPNYRRFLDALNFPQYLYWNKIKNKKPGGYAPLETWTILKQYRRIQSIPTIIQTEKGENFTWVRLSSFDKILNLIDRNILPLFETVTETIKNRLFNENSIEESIASSQLEGASTTRRAAIEMIRTKRKPINKSEQMIYNNYLAIEKISNDYKNIELSMEMLKELHSVLTENTLPDNEQGVFRTDSDEIVVRDANHDDILHIAPNMSFVEKELNKLIGVANEKIGISEQFVHPVMKAIMLHFWIGYLHPFTDGNGRLARGVFYWYLLRNNYDLFSYIPISVLIKKSSGQYRDAYLYSEQDDNDLTYFVSYNLDIINKAIIIYLENEINRINVESSRLSSVFRNYALNDRQENFLRMVMKNPNDKISYKIYLNIYKITRLTAMKDLRELEKLGFLLSKKIGKTIYFYSGEKIKELSNQIG